VSEKNMSLFSSGELDNGHCDFLLADEESERLDIFDEVVFCKQAFTETFHLDRSSMFYLKKFGILVYVHFFMFIVTYFMRKQFFYDNSSSNHSLKYQSKFSDKMKKKKTVHL
jgi:hypothetical protein